MYSINDFQHVRMSYQKGFTNPTIQTQYLAVNLGVQHSICGAKNNLERLGLTHLFTGNEDGYFGIRDTDGDDIISEQFDLDGDGNIDSTWFDGDNLNFLEPQYQKSFEIGFKGLITTNLYMDINYYTATYKNPEVSYLVGDPNSIVYNDSTGYIEEIPYEYYITTNKEETDKLYGAGVALHIIFQMDGELVLTLIMSI